ncbi:HxlR family transcriptional regulator [Lentzea atacamensis]|uniref:HxlR family transcriptional regulator n=2 Tax=Lentzea atacamensis TaxID=531938 RepID=A0A316IB70_9PSEU|nr:HxlR family transcriptional regulator [Lentzea atacamensis]RAS60626.1 HxlR family transcriptional regulator [Lentzea atacamensis]
MLEKMGSSERLDAGSEGSGRSAMRERNYRQYCGLASALDAVGDRWTLLVVRELLLGPRRYVELQADLPGIGTNLLAARLKKLRELGLVQRAGLAPHSYHLTAEGERMRDSVLALSRFGMGLLTDPTADVVVRPHWGFLAVAAMADAKRLPELSEAYEFRVDDEVFHLEVRNGNALPARGPAATPAMVATTDAITFVQIGAGLIDPMGAVAAGRLTLTGDPAAAGRCSLVLGLAKPTQQS